MRFSWFHLMPYRWLPADFRERYHGVWVDVPNRLYDPERGHELYNEYLDMLEYAGQMGFDGLGVNEHHQNAYGMMPSPNLMAAALARRSRRCCSCSATRSPSTILPFVSPRSSRCSTSCRAAG